MTHRMDPEYATLGGLLLAPDLIGPLRQWLQPGDFADPLCGELYQLLGRMQEDGRPVDPVTVLGELRRLGRLRTDGYPAAELVTMVGSVPVPTSTPYYARQVLEGAMFRLIEQAGMRLAQLGQDRRGTVDDAFAGMTATWRELAVVRSRWSDSQPATDSPAETDTGLPLEPALARTLDEPTWPLPEHAGR